MNEANPKSIGAKCLAMTFTMPDKGEFKIEKRP